MYFEEWDKTEEEQEMLNAFCIIQGTDNIDGAICKMATNCHLTPDQMAHEVYCMVKESTQYEAIEI